MDRITISEQIRLQGGRKLADYLSTEIVEGKLKPGMKLLPERELSERFAISRGAVRRVLALFREQGLISQSIGSGTFVTDRAALLADPDPKDQISAISTSPAELMVARQLIEPLMPGLIVQNATVADFQRLAECLYRSEAAQTIEEFEHWDEQLHKALAHATHNSFFVQILNLTNQVRAQGEWGRLKRNSLTPENRRSYESQHRAIVEALTDRDATLARQRLLEHLQQIEKNLFGVPDMEAMAGL